MGINALNKFKKDVTTSRYTPIFMVVVFVVVYLSMGLINHNDWYGLPAILLSAYFMLEMNTRYSLMRARSYMVSSVFIALSTLLLSADIVSVGLFAQLAYVLFTLIVFSTYHKSRMQKNLFVAYMLISIVGLFDVRILYLVPLLWITSSAYISRYNLKSFNAMLLGLLIPYWALLPYSIYQEKWTMYQDHFSKLVEIPMHFDYYIFNYYSLSMQTISLYVLIILLLLISFTHFIVTSFKEKIQTRQYYNMLSICALVLLVAIAIIPSLASLLLPMVIVMVSPSIAHYFTFTKGTVACIMFYITLLLLVLMVVANVYIDDWQRQIIDFVPMVGETGIR